MLPATPRVAPRGLPSNPKPRSRSTIRSRDVSQTRTSAEHYHQSPSHSLSRPGRQSERTRTPPLPEHRLPLHKTDARPQTSPSHSSNDSASSTTSSLLDRMKHGSGYASSRTSLEDDYKTSQSTLRPDNATRSLRQRRLPGENQNSPQAGYENASEIGGGYAIWSRVATVASTLTVSVSKAWATNITTFSGEETPPGQESRLTRAMKAYHLEKARDPADLPPWLFDERERRRAVSIEQASDCDADDNRHGRAESVNEMPRSRGLRDIYDAYRPEVPASQPSQRVSNEDPALPSKTTDRLKALRDARRNAGRTVPRPSVVEVIGDSQPRLGLPSGPRRL